MKKLVSTLLCIALVFGLLLSLPMAAIADEPGPFHVTENPVGKTYYLNDVADPISATFEYKAATWGYIDSQTPILVRWYWSYEDSNTDRTNAFEESTVAYSRNITHTTTHVPATDEVGVKYYYAVLSYAESVTVVSGQSDSFPMEAVSDPARIEVLAPDTPDRPDRPGPGDNENTIEQRFIANKVDIDGNPLAGAVLQLVPDESIEYDPPLESYEAGTLEDGIAIFSAAPGNYILSEKEAPEGYTGSDEKYYIIITEEGVFFNLITHLEKYEPVTFVNEKSNDRYGDKPGDDPKDKPNPENEGKIIEQRFVVKKTDGEGNLLSGAIIQLVPDGKIIQDPSVIAYEKTTVDGYATFVVGPGSYILSEKQAPEGFNATDDKYAILINEEGVFFDLSPNPPKKYEMLTFVNKPIPGLEKSDHFAYMQGYPEGTFLPENNMTRAEAVVMFSRLLSKKMDLSVDFRKNFYPDIDITNPDMLLPWYVNQVCYMCDLGVLADFSRDENFRPNEPVTRAEFATLASHFDELELVDTNDFLDVPDDHWAVKYINSAAEKGWIIGYPDKTFKPESLITRAEVVTLVNRMLERVADKEYLEANAGSLPRNYWDLETSYWGYLNIMEASTGHDYIKDSDGNEKWTEVYP